MGDDKLGNRMKSLEIPEVGRKFLPLLPICVRLDGRSFSGFTRKLKRPYDERFSKAMQSTTKFLVEETNAKIGYAQSDEISLILYSDSYKSQVYFNGKIQKIVSCLASLCSVYFDRELKNNFNPEEIEELFGNKIPSFDCRAWNVPNLMEATNTIVWREIDATKNSVSMATREYYSSKQMYKKCRADQMDMLMEKGVNWNDYPTFFKRGSYFQRKEITKVFSEEELDKLPSKHFARFLENGEFTRNEVVRIELPPVTKILNKVDVVINGCEVLENE